MKQTACGITDVGRKRKNNEDSFLVIEDKSLYIVADGMGGHNAGEVASYNAVNLVNGYLTPERIAAIQSEEAARKVMHDAVISAHEWILGASKDKKEYRGMGTTIVVSFIQDTILHTCHVGDSRAYIIHDGGIMQITNDHSHVGELVRSGKLTSEEARHSPIKNQITQALGSPFPVHPEYSRHPLDMNSRVLLCSDGLWDMLSDAEIHKTVMENGDEEFICKDLVKKANDAGGDDNITVVIVKVT